MWSLPKTKTGVLVGTLLLSLMVHGLVMLSLSLRQPPPPEKLRVVARVDVVDRVAAPAPKKKPAPPKRPPPPPPKALYTGDPGTRPGKGGDPAPAPVALRMDLPRTAPQAARPDSRVHRGASNRGADRGNPFGDPNGVPGGTGQGGHGPGGTGGNAGGTADPMAVLKRGVLYCAGCHDTRTRPINVEYLGKDTGWDIRGGAPTEAGRVVEAVFDFHLDATGKVRKVTVIKSSDRPEEREALVHFAAMHEFTPPGEEAVVRIRYLFQPGF